MGISWWEFHHPNWRTLSFFRGVAKNHQADIFCMSTLFVEYDSPWPFYFFRYVFHGAAQPPIRVDYLSHPADPAAVIWSWRRSYWAIQWWLGWPLSCKGIFDPTMASRHISPPLIIMWGVGGGHPTECWIVLMFRKHIYHMVPPPVPTS